MSNELTAYVEDIMQKHTKGNATEHTYRESLVTLSKAILDPSYALTNEPKRQACGAPDYILEKDVVPVGFIEAKDVGISLDKTETSEQMSRYLRSLDNLILTDYLEFRFFRKGLKIGTVSLAKNIGGKLVPMPSQHDAFLDLFKEFASYRTKTITSSRILAEMMANKARMAKDVFAKILADEDEPSSLHDQYEAFKTVLLHEITSDEFADIYAETLAYGLFTARLHDDMPDTFSKEKAYKLIPKSNPFLRDLFTYVGTKLDERADWIVDTLCDMFRSTNLEAILESFNLGTGRSDPFLHFYETFLGKYNPLKKKSRGVWYTPEQVVRFIVRGVDDLLWTEFNLNQGLADTSKTTIEVDAQAGKKRAKAIKKTTVKVKIDVPRVQVLDVATGTGTFLAEVIQHIHGKFANQQGLWSSYVEEHLIPRIHGFELLMASYSMCHMKLEMLLEKTGYKPKTGKQPRLNVYLTNSLQKPDEEVDKLPLIDWFTRESNEASYIKKNAPIMVAIGNPPYSSVSSNMGGNLIVDIEDYKYVKGVHFGERKHWLHDDYVKFIRMGEHYVAKNGEGILGYITNHSYLDNPTFRGMRWHLMNTFEKIHVIDLHGNANKSEISPLGIADKNVFDIRQGVSIILATRTKAKKKGELATVMHHELWGSRQSKYDALEAGSMDSIPWKKLTPAAPYFFFVPVSDVGREVYKKGFAIDELFNLTTTGIVTMGDGFIVDEFKDVLGKRVKSLPTSNLDEAEFKAKYGLGKNYASWALETRKKLVYSDDNLVVLGYRPFDTRFTYFDGKLVWRLRENVMKHMVNGTNVGLVVPKQAKGTPGGIATRGIVAHKTYDAYNSNSLFPLYLFDEKGKDPIPNLAPDIWKKIKKVGGKLAEDPQAVFDYVYAILHAPKFRTAYAEFMRVDFPRIPYPKSPAYFEKMAILGARMRDLHLFEDKIAAAAWTSASYPIAGNDQITKVERDGTKVRINTTQYFDDVSDDVWNMQVGGYWPAQKWLEDRKGQTLKNDQIMYYQTVAGTLGDTIELMSEIDAAY